MSTGKAQDRLDKLKSRLKTERSVVSVRPEKNIIKSSVVKPRKKSKNSLDNTSDEKKKKMKELINQTLNKPTESTRSLQAISRTNCEPSTSVEVAPPPPNKISRNNAQSRLKKHSLQKKIESDKPIPQPKINESRSVPNQTLQLKSQKQKSAVRNNALPEEKQPPSLQLPVKFKIPKKVDRTLASVKPSCGSTATSQAPKSIGECAKQPVLQSASSIQYSPPPVMYSAPTCQNSRGNTLYGPSSKAASSVMQPVTQMHPQKIEHPPEVKKNLFQRKTPGCDNNKNLSKTKQSCSREDLKTRNRPYQRPQEKPKLPTSGGSSWWGSVTKTCKDVVEAVKGHIAYGTERLSSYSAGRPDVTKQLQNVRTLVEPVEKMDFEISCPTFESEPSPHDHTDLHLVIDTNVVLDNLDLIQSLKFQNVKGMRPRIIIPWQVLKELDYLKENRNRLDSMKTKFVARQGIRFLLDEIISSDGFIGGQPQHVASRDFTNFVVEVPDDHLIKCCLQLIQSGYNVLLLTNDKNLVIKAVVSNVSCMRCDEFARIFRESQQDKNRTFTCFETPPVEQYSGHQLNIANAAHRVVILLRGFLSSALKKFWVFKSNNLWKLKSPGEEPWPLTSLLETACEVWDEISCFKAPKNSEVILFLRRFINKMSYERMTYQDLDQFGRTCHQLAISLPSSFGVEGITFDHSLAFLKCTEESGPPADASFIDCCVSLTIYHFQLFENKAVQYCYAISQSHGVPFSYPKISPTYQCAANLDDINYHSRVVSNIGRSLVSISSSPIGEITKSSEAAQTIHSALCFYLGELADHRFMLQDVVEFSNDRTMRTSFTTALQNLETLSTFLEFCSRR